MNSKDEVGVVAALIEKDGKVLICQRAVHKTYAGLWELPGGKVKDGESLQQALEREIREELQTSVRAGELVAATEFKINNDAARLFVLRAQIIGDAQPAENFHDHQAIQWIKIEEMASFPLTAPDMGVLPQLLNLEKKNLVVAAAAQTQQIPRETPPPSSVEGDPNMHQTVLIEHISPWSLGKLYALANFILGIFVALGMLWFGSFTGFGVGIPRIIMVAAYPFILMFCGFVAGVVMASAYNITSLILGGLEIKWKLSSREHPER